jgi:hypothetical protein
MGEKVSDHEKLLKTSGIKVRDEVIKLILEAIKLRRKQKTAKST